MSISATSFAAAVRQGRYSPPVNLAAEDQVARDEIARTNATRSGPLEDTSQQVQPAAPTDNNFAGFGNRSPEGEASAAALRALVAEQAYAKQGDTHHDDKTSELETLRF